MFDRALVGPAIGDSFRKLDPRSLARNPVIFITAVVSLVATLLFLRDLFGGGQHLLFSAQVIVWLWFTVLFANFAEAIAEGRGKAQAASLRKTKTETVAKRLKSADGKEYTLVPAPQLKPGDLVLIETNDIIPSDGEVVLGVATVDESAITGESAPVIRESGGDRSAVTGGTRVLSDQIVVRITAAAGSSFIDRMIALVEGASRQKTPNEIALNILLVGMSLIFVFATATIPSFAKYAGGSISVIVLVALFVCLIPTTIGALLSAIGIAGMNRLVRFNVLAMSGRAVEAAGDVDTLLLDKTGTITLGNRQAAEFIALQGVDDKELADAAQLASLSDETPEGRSVVVLAKEKYGLRGREVAGLNARFIAFSAQTRMSGVDLDGHAIRKGAVEAIVKYVQGLGNEGPHGAQFDSIAQRAVLKELKEAADKISRAGGTPLAVAKDGRVLGLIYLKDIVKGGIRERFAELRRMGIRTVMITGDNPALAQADVGVAMQTGTQAAREAGNMVDLDSDPTKLIEIVGIGKQLLMTRGALTTFSISNDVAKYFAIIPAMFAAIYPPLNKINIMHLATPQSAILSAIIFNALIIIALIPLALRGVKYRPVGAGPLLTRNLLVYGLGGIIVPFIGIKAIDLLVSAFGLA
jgi:K+-transporting ATPase ATPase B chain